MGETASNEVSNPQLNLDAPSFSGGLEVEGVSVSFGGLQALTAASFAVRRGEIVGLIGPNGAGKTTLFNVICGFVTPDSGSIRYEGRTLTRIKPHHLAGMGIARTLQALGLKRTGQRVSHEDTPALRGMLRKVAHLVEVGEGKAAR